MQAWIDARKRHQLSHAQVQMARQLGMNPKKLGKLDNHDQEPWKMPLKQYIEHLYFKRFDKERPHVVLSIEEKVRRDEEKKAPRREAKLGRRQAEMSQEKEPKRNNGRTLEVGEPSPSPSGKMGRHPCNALATDT